MPNTSFLVNSTENFNSLIPPDDGEVNAPEDENTTPSSILHSGSIKFPGIYSRSAQYVIVKENDNVYQELSELLHDPEKWGLKKPELIISITGALRSFPISNWYKTAIKKALVKAAELVDCWILTNGICSGISKIVGEAVAENSSSVHCIGIVSKSVIAFNHLLENDYKTISYSLEKDMINPKSVPLDPNHSHFILVDNHCGGELGHDLLFRLHLETELRKYTSENSFMDEPSIAFSSARKSSVGETSNLSVSIGSGKNDADAKKSHEKFDTPSILICVNGGYDALCLIDESMKQEIPILILLDTKGTADFVREAGVMYRENDFSFEDIDFYKLIEETKILERRKSRANYREILEDTVVRTKNIISSDNWDQLVTLNRFVKEEGSKDIISIILTSLLKPQKNNHFEKMKLVLQWNQIEKAKDDIFTGEERFRPDELCELLEIALVENKFEFVKLLIENGANLEKFLTVGRYYYLYNSKKIIVGSKHEPFYEILNSNYDFENGEKSLITFQRIREFLGEFVSEDLTFSFLPKDLNCCLYKSEDAIKSIKQYLVQTYEKNERMHLFIDNEFDDVSGEFDRKVENSVMNLFVWAVLLNRTEMAKIFWQIGDNQIGNAIFASILLSKMGHELSKNNIMEESIYFENVATGVLDLYDAQLEESKVFDKILKNMPFFGVNCLELASVGHREPFVASLCVQNHLTKTWYGQITNRDNLLTTLKVILSFMSLGLLAPFLAFDNRFIDSIKKPQKSEQHPTGDTTNSPSLALLMREEKHRNEGDQSGKIKEKRKRKKLVVKKIQPKHILTTYFKFYMSFLTSPYVIFCYESAAFFLFLLTFSYVILCEFDFYHADEYYLSIINNTFTKYINDSNKTEVTYTANDLSMLKKKNLKMPSAVEIFLMIWVVTIVIEELRQLFLDDLKSSLKRKLTHYLRDAWNYLDMSGCFLFFLGILLRYISLITRNENHFKMARVTLCVDLVIWFLRLLHFFTFFRSLGPKLVMIKKMIKDLLFFLCIMAVFVAAFGITTEAVLKKKSDFDFNMFKEIINKAYWPIFGTIEILADFSKISSQCNGELDEDCSELYGVVYSYVLLMGYVVVGNVLLINLLIAMFSSTFTIIQENADQIWKFQRYKLVYEYVDAPLLPPPLCFISYIYSTIMYIISLKTRKNKKDSITNSDLLDSVHLNEEYEKKFAEEFLEIEEAKKNETVIARLEHLQQKLNDF